MFLLYCHHLCSLAKHNLDPTCFPGFHTNILPSASPTSPSQLEFPFSYPMHVLLHHHHSHSTATCNLEQTHSFGSHTSTLPPTNPPSPTWFGVLFSCLVHVFLHCHHPRSNGKCNLTLTCSLDFAPISSQAQALCPRHDQSPVHVLLHCRHSCSIAKLNLEPTSSFGSHTNILPNAPTTYLQGFLFAAEIANAMEYLHKPPLSDADLHSIFFHSFPHHYQQEFLSL